jgi:Cys-rich repeat protein
VCTQGTCSPKGGCKSDKDCPATAQSHCELSSGKCVACVVDTHCKSNQICDNKTYTCTLKPGSCLSDINCTDKSRPYCVNSACVACRTDSECQRLYSCLNGACQLTGCNSDADCAADPTNKRCAPNKKCVLCTADAHCGAGQFCDMTSYTCAKKPACTTNADCKAPVPYCDATSKACVACTTNSQCKKDPNAAGLAVCSKGQCLGCQADKDCNLGFLCKAGTCIEGCNSNRDCPRTASICSSALKKCVECAQNSDCSSGSCDQAKGVCNYKCTQKDRTDSGCYQRDPNKRYCDGVTSTCVACIPRKYSPSYAYDIGCNTTNPRCVPGTRKCVKCLQDSDCPVSSGALKAVCDTTTNTCSECKTSSDCRRGLVCSKGTCTSGCLADADCPRGKVCGASNQCVDCSAKSPGCATGLVCDTKGERCVECVADKDCKTGEKCDTNIGRCLGLTGRTQCEPCNNATQCATGHTCITSNLIVNNTTVTETSCLKKCTSNSDCGTGYTCCSASNNLCNTRTYPNRKGHCWPNYARGGSTTSGEGYVYAATCRGSLTQGKACTTSGYGNTCGSGGISYNGRKYAEALCDVSAKVCRLPCSSNYPCQQGYTCECPAGATERNSYCYIGNRYYPKRCVK